MRILVTGVEGYIGSVLAPLLTCAGHDVVGLDTGFYRERCLFTDPDAVRQPEIISMDLRRVKLESLRNFDAIVHLAELSNDPLGEQNPAVTYDINHRGSVALATLAKRAGVRRFVYASSCSVYGVADGFVDETSQTAPQTSYAKCKVLVERDLKKLADDGFSPVFLRNATAYGASPHMRFDIVLNNLTGLAWTKREIEMTSDGTPWRPLVHVRDICKAIICAVEAPKETVNGQTFNVGNSDSNYQIREIAEIVNDIVPDCRIRFGKPDGESRSYRVNFDKIHQYLPDFHCEWDVRRGAAELCQIYERIRLTTDIFEARAFTRLKALTYLLESRQLDSDCYWTER